MECLSQKLLRNICHTRRHYSEILRLCPDITGSFSPNFNGDSGGFHFSSGAIYSGCFNRGKKVDFSCGWDRYGDDYALNFAAHYSNNVYGNSSSVSVPAAYSLIIIRT